MEITYLGIVNDEEWGEPTAIYEIDLKIADNGVYSVKPFLMRISLAMMDLDDLRSRQILAKAEIKKGEEMIMNELKTLKN